MTVPLAPADRAVVIMAKRPAPGVTKTRLTPPLTPQQAADLYECFLIDTLGAIERRGDCTPIIAIDAVESGDYFTALAPLILQVQQVGDTLGHRLDAVMSHCLANGFAQVFAIGSDSPDLPPEHLDAAFDALGDATTDLVLGPSDDGGYYLIGWKSRCGPVVTDVVMSTPRVLADTLAIAAQLGLHVALAPEWYDIDEAKDLDRLRAALVGDPFRRTARFLASL